MAKERVQVQGLGDVVPGIQPTIQRAGQYAVAQVRAAPVPVPRSKLLDLADTLKVGQDLLQQYGMAAEQEAQMFEEELSRKSPEEVQAMLKKTEGELDKQVRRGAMGWLTSPLNQKRKMQAVGALLHDDYERQLKAKVQDPANADADINELIAGVKDELRNQYGSLQSTFVNEGFEGAIRETTRRYTLQHDTLATAQAREEVKRAGVSTLFNASTIVGGELSNPEAIDKWWTDNQGSLTPIELAQLRKNAIVELATSGNFEGARKLQAYTANFKAGTTKMGDPDTAEDDVFGRYSAEEASIREAVDNLELQRDSRLVNNSKQELRIFDELAVDIGLAIRSGQGYKKEDGTFITTTKEAEAYLLGKLQESDNILVRGSKGVSVVQNALKSLEMPSDENYILFKEKYARSTTGPMAFRFRYEQIINDFNQQVGEEDTLTGKFSVDPRYVKLSNKLLVDMARKRDAKQLEISTGTFTDVNGELIVNAKFQDQMKYMQAWDDLYLKEYDSQLKTQSEKLAPKVELAAESKDELAEDKTDESFTMPGEKMSDLYGFGLTGTIRKTKYLTGRGDFTDLERLMRAGEDYEDFVKDLEEEELGSTLNILQSNKSTPEEQQIAKNKIALYTLAKGLYTAENIRNGVVPVTYGGKPSQVVEMTYKEAVKKGYTNIERTGALGVGALVKIPAVEPTTREINIDRSALKKLVDVFSLIPKDRLIEISTTEPEEFPEEQALYEAIYNVELDPESSEDQKLLENFIRRQAELSQKIYKK
jgi:hypothetical protein